MSCAEFCLAGVRSRVVLVFPPEAIRDGQCYCRFEPDGIAMLNGYLQSKGYFNTDLVYVSPDAMKMEHGINIPKHEGWALSPFDREGTSFRSVLSAAIDIPITSSTAASLRNLLPLKKLARCSILGLSVGFPSQLFNAVVIARLVKRLCPSVFVVMGGPLITSYITFIVTLRDLASVVDGIIAGYGEEPLARLIWCLNTGGDLTGVPNLRLSTENGFTASHLSWMPDRTTLLTIPEYGRATLQRSLDPCFPVRPSIGCYWGKCAFCIYPAMSNGTMGSRNYVLLTPRDLVEHIRALIAKGSGNRFELCSDSLPPHYLKQFGEEIIRARMRIRWSAWSCVDRRFLDEAVIDTMRRSGCEGLLMGVESACDRVLRRINKMQSRAEIEHVIDAFSLTGIRLFLTFCMGFPGETFEEALETIKFLSGLIEGGAISAGDDVRIYRFALMGNTPVAERFHEYGIASVDWSDMYYLDDDFSFRYAVSSGMSYDEVRAFVVDWRQRLGIGTDDAALS